MSNYSFTDQELNDAEALVNYLKAKYPKTEVTDQPFIGISTDPVDNSEAELLESGGQAITRLIKGLNEDTEAHHIMADIADPGMFKENTLMYAPVLTELIEQYRAVNSNQRRIGDLTVKEFKELMRSILMQTKYTGWL